MTGLIGSWGLKHPVGWKKYLLIPLWDATATLVWLASFTRNTIMWRGHEYSIQQGRLVPVNPAVLPSAESFSDEPASRKPARID